MYLILGDTLNDWMKSMLVKAVIETSKLHNRSIFINICRRYLTEILQRRRKTLNSIQSIHTYIHTNKSLVYPYRYLDVIIITGVQFPDSLEDRTEVVFLPVQEDPVLGTVHGRLKVPARVSVLQQ